MLAGIFTVMTESLTAKAGLKQSSVCLGHTELPQENRHVPNTSSGAPSEMMLAPQVQDDVASSCPPPVRACRLQR